MKRPRYTYAENLAYVRSLGCLSPEFFAAEPALTSGGYQLQQNPQELAHLLTYLQSQPYFNSYLEIGSASGGFIRGIWERVGFTHGTMIDDGMCLYEYQERNLREFSYCIDRHITNSHSPYAREKLGGRLFDLIFIDGDHSKNGVLLDVLLAYDHAHAQTLFVFHDVVCPEVPEVAEAYGEVIATRALKEVCSFVAEDGPKFGLAVARLP